MAGTHYATLGVSPKASATEIKNAYRVLARRYHPDVSVGTEAQFRQVSEAWEVLRDPARRAAYDAELTPARSPRTTTTWPASSAAPPSSAVPRQGRPASASSSYPTRPTVFAPSAEFMARQQAATDRHRPSARSAGPNVSRPTVRTGPADLNTAGGPWRDTVAALVNLVFPHPSGPPTARRGYFARPPGARVRWWAFPVTFAVMLVALEAQLLGLSGWLFEAHVGTRVLFGHWVRHPALGEGPLPASPSAYLAVAVLAFALTAGYAWRKTLTPTPRVEPAVLLVALFAACFAGEFLLATRAGVLTAAALVAVYIGWLSLLRQLPQPASAAQWASFPLWIRGVRAYYRTRAATARTAGK